MKFTPQKGRYSFLWLHCETVIFRDNRLRRHYRGMTVMGEVDLKGKGFNNQLADSKGTRETNSNNYTTNFYHFIRTCSQGFEGNDFFFFLLLKWACWSWVMHLFLRTDRSNRRFTSDIFLSIVIHSYGYVLFRGIKEKLSFGEMAEWLIAPVLKTGIVLNRTNISSISMPICLIETLPFLTVNMHSNEFHQPLVT